MCKLLWGYAINILNIGVHVVPEELFLGLQLGMR